ncbi:MAG TPA: dienelactone hydrolase family protein [Terriglobales bacterium]|nr:dienelactone hydrolase family protein [Terriglobales bacterium]
MTLFEAAVRRSTLQYLSDSQPITIQAFTPETGGAHPAVIALHGSGGIREGWAEQPASLLAGHGFAVFVIHYFERTGTYWADDRTIRQSFELWMKAVSDAITFASHQPQVDGSRVGLLGFSLGGYLALSVATRDPRVKAVVEYFGGLPEELTHELKPLPPTLVLHGERDTVVPVTEAHKLQHLFENTGTPYELKLYPVAGHGFSGFDLLDAGQRTLAFLKQHLH